MLLGESNANAVPSSRGHLVRREKKSLRRVVGFPKAGKPATPSDPWMQTDKTMVTSWELESVGLGYSQPRTTFLPVSERTVYISVLKSNGNVSKTSTARSKHYESATFVGHFVVTRQYSYTTIVRTIRFVGLKTRTRVIADGFCSRDTSARIAGNIFKSIQNNEPTRFHRSHSTRANPLRV